MDNLDVDRMMIEFSIDEIRMAEKYMRLIKECKEEDIINKIHEIAKQEIIHYDFLNDIVNKRLLNVSDGKSIKGELLEDVYNNWINNVKLKVEKFK